MKFVNFLFLYIFCPLYSNCQEIENLQKELSRSFKGDTVVIYGLHCQNWKSKYVLANSNQQIYIEFDLREGRNIKTKDSLGVGPFSDVIFDFVKNNYAEIVREFGLPLLFFDKHVVIKNGIKTYSYSTVDDINGHYLFGVYDGRHLKFISYLWVYTKMNENFKYANHYWVLCNLVKNEWGRYIDNL